MKLSALHHMANRRTGGLAVSFGGGRARLKDRCRRPATGHAKLYRLAR
jgi:hypothetical protein